MSDNYKRCIDADCPSRETCKRFIRIGETMKGVVFSLHSPRLILQDRCDEWEEK